MSVCRIKNKCFTTFRKDRLTHTSQFWTQPVNADQRPGTPHGAAGSDAEGKSTLIQQSLPKHKTRRSQVHKREELRSPEICRKSMDFPTVAVCSLCASSTSTFLFGCA